MRGEGVFCVFAPSKSGPLMTVRMMATFRMQREVTRCRVSRIAVSESRLEFPGQDHKFYDARWAAN
jgi:hypothetical protein